MNPHVPIAVAALASLIPSPACAGGAKEPLPAAHEPWQWSFSAGPSWSYMGRLSFAGGSRSQFLTLPSFVGDASLSVPPIGDPVAIGDRFYHDGYVRQDAGTAVDGSTWFWGYDNSSQVIGDNLVYQATGFESIRSDSFSTVAGRNTDDGLQSGGLSLRADVTTPWTLGPFRVGGIVGMSLASDSQSYRFANHRATQTRDDYRHDYRDTYALGGVVPPEAPYAGGPVGPGPLISNLPSSRSLTPVLVFTDTAVFTNDVRAQFENEMLSVLLGGTLEHEEGPWSFMVAGGLILEFHRYTSHQSETLNGAGGGARPGFASWSEGRSGTKFRPGLFAELSARYALDRHCFLDGFIRGEIADEFRVRAGPSSFEFEPVGFSIGLRIGASF